MSERRRMLLAIVNQFKWLPYSYTYLYHSLVPQTISGKNVRNKAKLTKIYGNSEVRNQLFIIPTISTQTLNGITLTNNGDGSITISGTATAQTTFTLMGNLSRDIPLGHKVLITNFATPSNATYYLYDAYESNVTATLVEQSYGYIKTKEGSSTIISPRIRIENGTVISTPQTVKVMYFDLTQAYPFDTPTTLTDNRVKNILAQGYIPYNTGEIKDMEIGEIGSRGFNIWDEEYKIGLIQYDKTQSNFGQDISGSNLVCKNYISVEPNTDYYFQGATPQKSGIVFCYDKDYNPIIVGSSGYIAISSVNTFTTPSNCAYIRFYMANPYGQTYNNDICINISSSLNGTYKPYQTLTALQLPAPYKSSGIGTSKDSWEITNTSHIFTRNDFHYTFTGNESWTLYNNSFFYISISGQAPTIDGVGPISNNGIVLRGASGSNFGVRVYLNLNANITSSTDMNSVFPNKTVILYPLATPQTITIPKKHLAVVDLGSLNWTYISGSNSRFVADVSNIKLVSQGTDLANIYCSQYMTDSVSHIYSHTNNNSIGVHNTYQQIWIYDSAKNSMSTTDFKNAMSGIYLFYETDTEVPDITDTFDIEAGGSVNGNLFSWVENQVFDSTKIPATSSSNGITFTNNGDGSYSLNGTASAMATFIAYNVCTLYKGHKYLLRTTPNGGSSSTYLSGDANGYLDLTDYGNGVIANTTFNDDTKVCALYWRVMNGYAIQGTITCKPMIIDLTTGFGAGNEPTDINDYRIQYILEHGYIPTNTTGTYTSVDTQVLPNVDMSFKCK